MTGTTSDFTTEGSFASEGGQVAYRWVMPAWSRLELVRCAAGLHRTTRKLVVSGHIKWLIPIEHHYCACGSHRWMKYNGTFGEESVEEPGGHRRWIEGQAQTAELRRSFAEQLAATRQAE